MGNVRRVYVEKKPDFAGRLAVKASHGAVA